MLTNAGEIQQHQIQMLRERVRTIGISVLGAKNGVKGPYELNIDSIRAVNEEDVTESDGSSALFGGNCSTYSKRNAQRSK